MKLPSIQYLFTTANQAFLRFPMSILSSILAGIMAIYLFEYGEDIDNIFPYLNFLLSAALGIPLYFGVRIFCLRYQQTRNFKLIVDAGATLLLVIIYFSLPDSEVTFNLYVPYIRYAVFNIIVHLVVSFAPFVKQQELNGFWNYNKTLFIRFLASVLYSGVLYIGLVLALTALRLLFNVDIDEKLYFDIFLGIIGFFNTWFFVAGIPDDLDVLEGIRQYPKGLKVFTQYVLLPLLLLYLVILFAYIGKILVEWDWPKGIVSYLISVVSVLGILTTLLIYPYSFLQGNSWISQFRKFYFYSIFPLIVTLFIAIGIRIGDYGITINRYIIVLLGIWLTLVASYFTLGRKNIKFIPVSLAVIMLLMSFGPWGMFSVGEKSQAGRLQQILEVHQLLDNGKVVNEVRWELDTASNLEATAKPTNNLVLADSLKNEVKSILDYLDRYHGFESVKPFLNQDLSPLIQQSLREHRYVNEARIYMMALGFSYRYHSSGFKRRFYNYQVEEQDVQYIGKYEYIVDFDSYRYHGGKQLKSFEIDEIDYEVKLGSDSDWNKIMVSYDNDLITFALDSLISDLQKSQGEGYQNQVPIQKMSLEGSGPRHQIKLLLRSLEITEEEDSTWVNHLQGRLLLKKEE